VQNFDFVDALHKCGKQSGGKPPHSKLSDRAAAGTAVYDENCGVGFAIPEMKKAAETSAAVGNNSHSYPENRVPNEVRGVKEFLRCGLISDLRDSQVCALCHAISSPRASYLEGQNSTGRLRRIGKTRRPHFLR